MKKLVMFASAWFGLLIGISQAIAAPPGSIPVYCDGVAIKAAEVVLFCYRADTRANVVPVPEGMVFHVTDIVVTPNGSGTSGLYSVLIGRDDNGDFPASPSLELLGEAAGALNLTTAYIVLESGESLSVRTQENSVLSALNMRMSGYLATQARP